MHQIQLIEYVNKTFAKVTPIFDIKKLCIMYNSIFIVCTDSSLYCKMQTEFIFFRCASRFYWLNNYMMHWHVVTPSASPECIL